MVVEKQADEEGAISHPKHSEAAFETMVSSGLE
jgi:hypothetical protein